MWENVGKKIMKYAQVLAWLSLLAGVILWVIYLSEEETGTAFIWLLAGVFAFLDSWFLYGFGQLIDATNEIRNRLTVAEKEQEAGLFTAGTEKGKTVQPISDKDCADFIVCPICNTRQWKNRNVCFGCGAAFENNTAE